MTRFLAELPIEQMGMTQGQMPTAWKEGRTMLGERKSGETIQKQKGKLEPVQWLTAATPALWGRSRRTVMSWRPV